MPENLPELRDIHLPESVSLFPPAYGWWVIIASIIGAWLLWRSFKLVYQKSKKIYARKLLNYVSIDNPVEAATEISAILRRVCVVRYKEALGLSGAAWINFLQSHTKENLPDNLAQLLQNAPYMQKQQKGYTAQEAAKLREFGYHWIGENL